MSLVSMQKKFSSKLIVFGSAVFDDIGNHIASAVFEYVNIFFFVGFFFLLYFSCLQMIITFLTFVGFRLRVSSDCVYWVLRVTES